MAEKLWIDLVNPDPATVASALPEGVYRTALGRLLAPVHHADDPRRRVGDVRRDVRAVVRVDRRRHLAEPDARRAIEVRTVDRHAELMRSDSELASAFESLGHGDFVGVFQVAADG